MAIVLRAIGTEKRYSATRFWYGARSTAECGATISRKGASRIKCERAHSCSVLTSHVSYSLSVLTSHMLGLSVHGARTVQRCGTELAVYAVQSAHGARY
eukprot:3939510-Rhodomonas_salina.1